MDKFIEIMESGVFQEVVVATDVKNIRYCENLVRCYVTRYRSSDGTSRVAEVSQMRCDYVVNIQGDEPMLDPRS